MLHGEKRQLITIKWSVCDRSNKFPHLMEVDSKASQAVEATHKRCQGWRRPESYYLRSLYVHVVRLHCPRAMEALSNTYSLVGGREKSPRNGRLNERRNTQHLSEMYHGMLDATPVNLIRSRRSPDRDRCGTERKL
jgi:hypothetical protein